MQTAAMIFLRSLIVLFALLLCAGQLAMMLSYDLDNLKRPEGMLLPAVSMAVFLMTYTWTAFFDKPMLKMSRKIFWLVVGVGAIALLATYMICFGHMPQTSRIHLNAPVNSGLAFIFFFFGLLGVAGDEHVRWMRKFKAGPN